MPDMPDARLLADRLGGPWAISWLACGINAGLASSIFLAEGLSGSGVGLAPWLILILISLIPPVVAVAVIDRTLLRNRQTAPVSPVLVVAMNGFLGGLFNVAVWVGSSVAGIPTASASMSSVITVVIMSMWWGSALTIFLDYRDESRSIRSTLIEDSVRIELIALQQDEILLGMHAELTAVVDEELQPLREDLRELRHGRPSDNSMESSVEAEKWAALAERMLTTAQDSVRPLSRQLWQQSSLSYPRTPWWSIVTSVPRNQPFRAILLAGVHMTLTTGPSIEAFGIGRGLALVAAEALAIILIASAFNALMARWPRHHIALFITGMLVLQASIPLRSILREQWQSGSATPGWQMAQFIVGVTIIWITSGISSWIDATGQIRREFRAEIDQAAISSIARSRQMSDLASTAARQLHGTVQTRLVACALAIDQAAAAQDFARLNEALREALYVLDAPLLPEVGSGTVRDEVDRKVSPWQGICHVDVVMDDAIGRMCVPATPIGLIVEEGIANSVRRGDASWVRVSVQAVGVREIRVVIEDDGKGPGTGPPGIGSAIIEQVTSGHWRLAATPRGSVLTASIPAE